MDQGQYEAARERLIEASKAYYGTGETLMSDEAFDALLAQAFGYETQHGIDDPTSPTRTVGHGVPGGNVTHTIPMLSLEKVTDDALDAFLTERGGDELVVEPKLDGLAVSLQYRNGRLARAVTRGDGLVGKDVTHSAIPALRGVPDRLEGVERDFEVRGEILMRFEDFDILDEQRQNEAEQALVARAGKAKKPAPEAVEVRAVREKAAFANPRNAAAGIVNSNKQVPENVLVFVAYQSPSLDTQDYDSIMEALGAHGFTTPASAFAAETGEKLAGLGVREQIDLIEKHRPTLPFGIDGAVIKVNSAARRADLGEGNRVPRWAAAYKYQPMRVHSVLRALETAIGPTGQLGLRFKFDKVRVDGSKVEYATGHNPTWIAEMDLRIGDTVDVLKRGDIIPRVENPNLDLRPADAIPVEVSPLCPSCGEELDQSSLLWRCHTPECSIAGKITYGVSRDAGLDIQGLGEKIVIMLVEQGVIEDLADVFEKITVQNLSTLDTGRVYAETSTVGEPGTPILVGEKTAETIMAEIDKAKTAPLARVITALAIRKVGRTMGRALAKHFGSLEAFANASVADLEAVDGIATGKSVIIHAGLQDMRGAIDRLLALGLGAPIEQNTGTNGAGLPLAGQVVCVTGSVKAVPAWASLSRNQVNEMIESYGGTSTGSVSTKTTLLVCEKPGSSKEIKARQLGIKVVTPEEFAEMVCA